MKHHGLARGLALLLAALFLLSFTAVAVEGESEIIPLDAVEEPIEDSAADTGEELSEALDADASEELSEVLDADALEEQTEALTADAGSEPPGGYGGGGSEPPGGYGGGGDKPSGGGGSSSFYTGTAVTELSSGTYTGQTFADSTNASEVAVRVGPGVTATVTDSTVTKSAGDLQGDDASFYGVNSGILAYSTSASSPANLTLDNVTVTTSSTGANAVFAYGDATVRISDSTVTTNGSSGAGGIMVAGGGTLYAENCDVTTVGGSSAAIRSDRGSGTMVVNGGSYIATGAQGTGSPAIYCVADITVSNATLSAGNAQAICFEGRNPAKIYNCYLEGNYTASDDDENCNVMIYQSMSGDSAEGTTYCTMVGGVLKANNTSANGNAKMFYTTNTYCYISLCDVQMVYSDTMDTFLLCACNTNSRGWGTSGANGSECVLYAVDQDMAGNIIYDTWSYLGIFMRDASTLSGAIQCREDNGSRGCDLYLGADSVWTVTGNSTLRDFHNAAGTLLDNTGAAVTVASAGGTVYQQGTSAYTVTVTGTYDTQDLTAEKNVPGIGTVSDGEYTFNTDISAYFDSNYTPTAPDGTLYTDTMGHRQPAHTHSWIGVLTTPMTATQDGLVTYTCETCGQTTTTCLPAGGSPFADVQDSSQYYSEAVLWAVSENIAAGISDFEFSPAGPCTRAQVITFLWRAAGKPKLSGSLPFTDVEKSDYYYRAVLWAYQNNIVVGTSATSISPNAKVTRAQFLTILWRYAGKPAASGTSNPFQDVLADQYYTEAVLWGSENNIVNGTAADTFSPEDTCTRAQVVTFLYRYFGA